MSTIKQEEGLEKDHRGIGQNKKLFHFHELSLGSCFFMPRGTNIYNTLCEALRSEYRKRGYQEVVTPNIFNHKLFEDSGLTKNYDKQMFKFEVEKDLYTLKAVNCPGHCLLFDLHLRSWRELPLRFVEFGILHRNEVSEALCGLTCARKFQQDDGHIFCTPEQVIEEIRGCLKFIDYVYSILGITYSFRFATHPENCGGDPAAMDKVETQIEEALKKFGKPWERSQGKGAFCGPRIEAIVNDTIRGPQVFGVIQLDYVLAEKFNLTYMTGSGCSDDKPRPVVIHRTILGSVEQMIALLTEKYPGKWPFWLSPCQAIVITKSPNVSITVTTITSTTKDAETTTSSTSTTTSVDEYAVQVKSQLFEAGLNVDVDLSPGCVDKKIEEAQKEQYNFILVVGEEELAHKTVSVVGDHAEIGEVAVEKFVEKLAELKKHRAIEDSVKF